MMSWKSALLFGVLQTLAGVSALPAVGNGILARSEAVSQASSASAAPSASGTGGMVHPPTPSGSGATAVTSSAPNAGVTVEAPMPSGTGVTANVPSPSGAGGNPTAPQPSGAGGNGTVATAGEKRRIGYYSAFDWARAAIPPKIEALKFKPEIELKGLTHVILAFADMTFGDQAWVHTSLDKPDKSVYASYKQQFPELKVGVAFGGWGFTEDVWKAGMASEQGAADLLNKFDGWLKKWDPEGTWFDLIDIDYEYPKANEAEGFKRFLKMLKEKFPDKELSVAVSAIPEDGKGGYDGLGSVNEGGVKTIDFFNIMTYDLRNRLTLQGGHHSSLTETLKAVSAWNAPAYGLQKADMNVGFAFYAKWFHVKNPEQCDAVKNPSSCEFMTMQVDEGMKEGCSTAANYSAPGVIDCGTSSAFRFQPKNNFNTIPHDVVVTGHQTTTYDDAVESFKNVPFNDANYYDPVAKASTFLDTKTEYPTFWTWQDSQGMRDTCDALKGEGLGGYMIWSLGGDDDEQTHLKALQDTCWQH